MSSKRYGSQTVLFDTPPVIRGCGSIVGEKEGMGPFGNCFDEICMDPMIGGKSWEEGESNLVKRACRYALKSADMKKDEIDYIVGGDLLGQIMATTFGVESMDLPFIGLYGACSTMGEALMVGGMLCDGGYADRAIAVTSSHFASAEKQFRFPLGYGAQRPKASTWTVTGSGAVIIEKGDEWRNMPEHMNRHSEIVLKGFTTGKIVDYGVMDSMNMGAAMAPAAADTLFAHFKDIGRKPSDYDLIVTGDLGKVGSEILKDFMKSRGFDISQNHFDCGAKMFHDDQDTHSGGSGCGCSATLFCAYLYKELKHGRLGRILFMPTGALLSPVSFHEGKSVPGIAHAVIVERVG